MTLIKTTVKIEDIERDFRNAASKGDTSKMLDILKEYPHIKIDSPGPLTGKTAAHRAVENNQIGVLHLLLTLGVDFERATEKQKAPILLENQSEETQNFFRMLKIAQYLNYVTAQNLKPIRYVKEQEEYFKFANKLYHTWVNNRKKEITEPIFEGCIPYKKFNFQTDRDSQQRLTQSIFVLRLQLMLEMLSSENITHVGCGEYVYFAYAVLQKFLSQLSFSVEIIDIVSQTDSKKGKNFLVFNRDPDSPLHDPSQWGLAIIVDVFDGSIYSSAFLTQLKKVSLLKNTEGYKLTSLFSKTIMDKGFINKNGKKISEVKEVLEWLEKDLWEKIQRHLSKNETVVEVQDGIAQWVPQIDSEKSYSEKQKLIIKNM